jgi:membrane protease YdiL (CAAX protease family)
LKAFIKRHPVLTYYALVFAISWGSMLIIVGPNEFLGTKPMPRSLFLLIVVLGPFAGPFISGILVTDLISGRAGLRGLFSRLLRWRVGARWYAIALLTAPLLTTATLFALSLTSPAFLPIIVTSADKATLLASGIVAGLVVGFFEELGWTGFAMPELRKRYGMLTTELIMGVLWGTWHFPLFSGSARSAGAVPPALYVAVLLFSFLLPYRVLMVWVYDRTKSVLVAMLMHATLVAGQFILNPAAVSGVRMIIGDLTFAAALWLVVAAVVVANSGKRARDADTSAIASVNAVTKSAVPA